MALFRPFPQYARHADVECFNCSAPLSPTAAHGVVDSGHADGHGRYALYCDDCGMRTWYDLKPCNCATTTTTTE